MPTTRSTVSDPADALERINDVLRLARSAVWEIDRDGVFTYVSPSFENLLGYRPEELVGIRTIHDFYPPDVPPELERECARDWLGEARAFTNSEVPLVAKSGEIVWVASDGKPIFDKEGNLAGFRGADTDITPRIQAEKKARAADEFLLQQIGTAPVAIAYTRVSSTKLHVNKAFVAMFGYLPEEIPTVDAWFLRAYPDATYRDEVIRISNENMARANAGDSEVGPQEFKIARKDGEVRDIEIASAMVGGCFFGTFTDRTIRNRALAELRDNNFTLRNLLDNAPLGIVRMRLDSQKLWVNKTFTALLGYTNEDIPNLEAWFERAYPDLEYREAIRAEWKEALRLAVDKGDPIPKSQVRVVAKSGREHEMQFSGVVVRDEVFGMWSDLTERNRAERQLREQRDLIAHSGRVSALGQLAASLAHELDQPLGAILNNAEAARLILAKKKPSTSELLEILDDIVEDDRRAGNVLDRIRAMVQKEPFRAEPVEVPGLFAETLNLVQAAAAKKGIKLEISCEPGLFRVEGDRVLLHQALLNLVLNSIDAIGERREGIISLRAGEADAGRVGLSVSDNGGGLPRGDTARFLQPFHTTKQGGLGMGLPIVNSIVEQHAGSLRLDNQPGRGLTVSLLLPAWRDPARR